MSILSAAFFQDEAAAFTKQEACFDRKATSVPSSRTATLGELQRD